MNIAPAQMRSWSTQSDNASLQRSGNEQMAADGHTDTHAPRVGVVRVCLCQDDVSAYDCLLSQPQQELTMVIQLLERKKEDDSGSASSSSSMSPQPQPYAVFHRHSPLGAVGTPTLQRFTNLGGALAYFVQQFYNATGTFWGENRASFRPKHNKFGQRDNTRTTALKCTPEGRQSSGADTSWHA